jgi:hypothetical protein
VAKVEVTGKGTVVVGEVGNLVGKYVGVSDGCLEGGRVFKLGDLVGEIVIFGTTCVHA